jgi:hypothetical protein
MTYDLPKSLLSLRRQDVDAPTVYWCRVDHPFAATGNKFWFEVSSLLGVFVEAKLDPDRADSIQYGDFNTVP